MTNQQKYVQEILQKYIELPDTPIRFNASDQRLAERLYDQGIGIQQVEAGLLLASARRLFSSRARTLGAIRSLHYFIPVIMEVIEESMPDEYVEYLRRNVLPYLKSSKKLARAIG